MPETRAARGRVPKADERPRRPGAKRRSPSWRSSPGSSASAIGVLGTHYTLIGVGVALAGIGGMEVAIREHFAGYRSHTTLLAGFVFVVVVAVLFYEVGMVLAYALPIGAVCFAAAFYLARRAFQRASGGLSFRIGGMRG